MIISDSLSCLQAILNRHYHHPIILEILEKCHLLITRNKIITFCWVPSHVGITGNEKADAAAKAALQLNISVNIHIPYADFKYAINKYFLGLWQDHWTNNATHNKLQSIKPILGETKIEHGITRRDEVVLHRSRIGHTHLTHAYLLKRDNVPMCNACHCQQTVQHLLLDCTSYAYIRGKHFNFASLFELFTKTPQKIIINYLKDTNLYDKF
jgi:hypothetical protein